VEIEFDPAKSDRNLAERGFGFRFAARVFQGRPVSFQDSRHDYGEVRMVAIGEIDGKLYKVVYNDRDEIRRIISANPASRQEKRLWHMSE